MLEFNHKVCFSMEPVKQCRPGTFADNSVLSVEPKQAKVQFVCIDRHSVEAKRLKKMVRSHKVTELKEFPISFQELVAIPERCIKH